MSAEMNSGTNAAPGPGEATWFYASDAGQAGPVSLTTLGELARTGQLMPNQLVWGPELPEWLPAQTVPAVRQAAGWPDTPLPPMPPGPQGPGPKTVIFNAADRIFGFSAEEIQPLPHVAAVGRVLERLAGLGPVERLNRLDRNAVKLGNVLYPVSAILLIVAVGYLAIQESNFNYFLKAAGLIVAVATLSQFLAHRFFGLQASMIAKAPSRLSSEVFLECMALLSLLGAIGSWLVGVTLLFDGGQIGGAFVFLVFGCVYFYAACAALQTESLGIQIEVTVPHGEDALGVAQGLLKLSARCLPVAYGAGTLLGFVGAVYLVVRVIQDGAMVMVMPAAAMFSGQDIVNFALAVAYVPVMGSLIFLGGLLVVQLLQSVLSRGV